MYTKFILFTWTKTLSRNFFQLNFPIRRMLFLGENLNFLSLKFKSADGMEDFA